ncbi:uncharacterized protein LOC134690370 [Mytilus trossulus]|uniref:uncharacterized protein LOC134690370 n=1 Tax=Mytilus trossulus TaxID=6551 RepID=UPI00300782A7
MVPMTVLFIFMLLNSHQVALETVIVRTYYNTELSWTDAKDYCFNQSSILEANHTDTMTSFENETAQIWTGSYTTWSNWAVIWGCYMSPQTVFATFEDTNDGKYDCQQYCQLSQYFAFEGGACYCLGETGSPVSYSYCQTPRQTPSYVIVNKQNIIGVLRTLDDTPEDQLKCMSAQCQDGEIILRSENCNSYYEGICESGFNNGSNTTQPTAATLCDNADSFLQWYNNKSFCNTGKTNQLWTSATRVINTYDLTTNDQTSSINPLMCEYMDFRNSSTSFGNCTDRRTFICRFEKIVLPSETFASDNILGISMYGLMGLISLMIVIIIIVVSNKTSYSKTRKKEKVKEHAAVVNKRSYSVQITELQSPLEDIIEDSDSSNEQSSDGRSSGNGSVLGVQTSFKKDKLNKRLTTFKRGSHRSKVEIGNITTRKVEGTIDNDESISNICHTKTQTEQSILNSNTTNVDSYISEHIPSITSSSDHEEDDHHNNDLQKQYQPNKPAFTINQENKTDTRNNNCPELALQVDFADTKDTKNFAIPARDTTNELSGNADSKDVENSSRREMDLTYDLTGDYDHIDDPEDVPHASQRQFDFSICSNELTSKYDDIKEPEDAFNVFRIQNEFSHELTGDYDDIKEPEDSCHASRIQNQFTHELSGDYDDMNDSKDMTGSSRGQLDFTNELTGGDYDDIDTTEEMLIHTQPMHVFTNEQTQDYDEIDERKDTFTPNEEKHLFTKKLSLNDIYDGIEETTNEKTDQRYHRNEIIPADNASKFNLTLEKDRKSSFGQFDDYDEIEDSSDAMYTTTEPYIGMSPIIEQYIGTSQGSGATTEQYIDMSHGIRATQLSNSEGRSTTNTNSNNPSPAKLTTEPIYAISTKKSVTIKFKEPDLVPETLLNSENIATTKIDSNNSSSSITNEPIYAISTKKSIKSNPKESDLVTEPVYAISSKIKSNDKPDN